MPEVAGCVFVSSIDGPHLFSMPPRLLVDDGGDTLAGITLCGRYVCNVYCYWQREECLAWLKTDSSAVLQIILHESNYLAFTNVSPRLEEQKTA